MGEQQTLHVARVVSLYRIPPRGPTGHSSGDWRIADRIFEGRMQVVSCGERCDLRFEDSVNADLFAVSPIPYGKRTAYVEPAIDSTRNFVVRVEDVASKQHAWLGMSFAERSESFDFNEALLRHDKYVERDRAAAAVSSSAAPRAEPLNGPSLASQQHAVQEVQALNANNDNLALKEGQTIRVNVPKRAPKPGGLMSSTAAAGFSLKAPP